MSLRRSESKPLSLFALSIVALFVAAIGCDRADPSASKTTGEPATIDDFVALTLPVAPYQGRRPVEMEPSSEDVARINVALRRIEANWPEGSATMLVDTLQFLKVYKAKFDVKRLLDEKAGIRDLSDPQQVLKKIWQQEYKPHPHYAEFKSKLYAWIDPKFTEYFNDKFATTIRLDEVRWGGVQQDGIPPLINPKVISVSEATYLDDSNVVFGVYANGESRCYPKRILAWHEMVKDKVGGISINGVYCTLCGSMIVYLTELDGKHYELGTSGFLYRSNKLMYDRETQSMWSTIEGKPVVGKLVGKNIQLKRHHVVTTTWGQWKKDHPDTTVLSLETGHERDYGEGVAYAHYFGNDELMFTIPHDDKRLKNKAEVVALVFENAPIETLAIAADFLSENRIYHDKLGGKDFVILTDESGANRVYESGKNKFLSWNGETDVVDEAGTVWQVSESRLYSKDGQSLNRLPSHRAFWFGWHSAYPNTRLVK